MAREKMFDFVAVGILSVLATGQFVCSPVFAENQVDISIVELVDDGSGGFKPWEDITDAMPGMTYSAIPRVRNDGLLAVSVRMCLSESVMGPSGNMMALQSNAFEIDINESWVPSEGVIGDNSVNKTCYDYKSMIGVGEITEPIFSEVTLSNELGNEYENSTFNLHLEAEAVSDDESEVGPSPAKPDTGLNTVSYLEVVSPVFLAAGGVAFFAMVAYLIRLFKK